MLKDIIILKQNKTAPQQMLSQIPMFNRHATFTPLSETLSAGAVRKPSFMFFIPS